MRNVRISPCPRCWIDSGTFVTSDSECERAFVFAGLWRGYRRGCGEASFAERSTVVRAWRESHDMRTGSRQRVRREPRIEVLLKEDYQPVFS